MVRQPLPKIARDSEIPLEGMIYASENIDIFHALYSVAFGKSFLAFGNLRVSWSSGPSDHLPLRMYLPGPGTVASRRTPSR